MAFHAHDEHDHLAERTTRLLSHLDGTLDASMLDAMQGAWSMLEDAATEAGSHSRAVRSRLLWESMSPGGWDIAAPVSPLVHDLVPEWDVDEDEGPAAEAA